MNNLPVIYKPYKIYLHLFPCNGVYVGQTKQKPEQRWLHGYKNNPLMLNAIYKYGWENVKHIILFDNLDEETATIYETGLIKAFRKYKCYNISDGGKTPNGFKYKRKPFTEEHRKKLSEAHKGKQTWMKGKHHSDISKQKLSEAKRGKNNTKKSKPVLQYTLDMVFVMEYPSVSEASRQTGINHSSICCAITGKRGYTHAGGYVWRYKD